MHLAAVLAAVWLFEARRQLLAVALLVGLMACVPALHRAGLTEYALVLFVFVLCGAARAVFTLPPFPKK